MFDDDDEKSVSFFLIANDYEQLYNYNKLLKNNSPVYLGSVLNTEKEILNYCTRELPEPVPFNLELKRNWKPKSEELETEGFRRENKKMFLPSILVLK